VDMKATASDCTLGCKRHGMRQPDTETPAPPKRNSASSTPVDHFTCIVCLVNLEVAVEARGRILVDGEPIGRRGSGIKSLRVSNDSCTKSSPTLASQMLDGGHALSRLQTLGLTVQ
jgi:hypothetical protein